MANDLDQFPLFDKLVKPGTDKLSDVWMDSLATFLQNLTGYLSRFGVFLPQITTNERDSIQNPVNGQIIYNTTLDTAQYFKAGVWTSI